MKLIDADGVYQETLRYSNRFRKSVLKIVNALPTVDVAEVKHGHWNESIALMGKSICSNCQLYWIDTDSQYDFNYCPRCGARMDGKEQENE